MVREDIPSCIAGTDLPTFYIDESYARYSADISVDRELTRNGNVRGLNLGMRTFFSLFFSRLINN